MAGTIKGGRQAAATNKELYGEDFYKRIGAKGGLKKDTVTPKGFAALSTERRREIASKGGKAKKRVDITLTVK